MAKVFDRRRLPDRIKKRLCPKCGGKKPEGEKCEECGFRYCDRYVNKNY